MSRQASLGLLSLLDRELLGFGAERGDKFFMGIEWPIRVALFHVAERLCESGIYFPALSRSVFVVGVWKLGRVNGYARREHDFAFFDTGLQKIANVYAGLLADLGWDNDLVFVFDGNKRHRTVEY